MAIDWTKPIQTRGGLPARVLCTDRKGFYPVLVLVLVEEGGREMNVMTGLDGLSDVGEKHRLDIINVPQKVVRYVNMYRGVVGVAYSSRALADKGAWPNRIACIRVEYTEGRFDD